MLNFLSHIFDQIIVTSYYLIIFIVHNYTKLIKSTTMINS